MLDLGHTLRGTHTFSQTITGEGRRLHGASKRPPGVTYSLFTNKGRLAASACCVQSLLCRRDMLGSDERGQLCRQTSLFTPSLSVCLSVTLYCSSPGKQTNALKFFQSGKGASTGKRYSQLNILSVIGFVRYYHFYLLFTVSQDQLTQHLYGFPDGHQVRSGDLSCDTIKRHVVICNLQERPKKDF